MDHTEKQKVRVYRLVLRGITLKEIMKTDLGCEYRARMSEIRKEMKIVFGDRDDGWIPCQILSRKKGERDSFWKMVIPPNANPDDPLGYFGEFRREKKSVDMRAFSRENSGQFRMF